MKLKIILAVIMGVILLCLPACSGTTDTVSVAVTCDDFANEQDITEEIEVMAGASFTVTLCSNPTTGFSWETAVISAPDVLEQAGHEFISPESDPPPPPGSPGQEVWTFKALEKGTGTIDIAYSRPWEGGEKASWTFQLKVVVK